MDEGNFAMSQIISHLLSPYHVKSLLDSKPPGYGTLRRNQACGDESNERKYFDSPNH